MENTCTKMIQSKAQKKTIHFWIAYYIETRAGVEKIFEERKNARPGS